MGAEKKDIWDRGDGFNGCLRTPEQNRQLLDGLAGRSDGSPHGQLGDMHRQTSAQARSNGRSGKGGSISGVALVVLLLVLFMVWYDSSRLAPARTAAPAAVSPPAPPRPLRATARLASSAQVDRFVVQRPQVRAGEPLQVFVDWTPDVPGARAHVTAFAVTRDAHQRRTPLGRIANAYAGPSTLSFDLPADLAPGKYEIEVVWSFGNPSIESRDNFVVMP